MTKTRLLHYFPRVFKTFLFLLYTTEYAEYTLVEDILILNSLQGSLEDISDPIKNIYSESASPGESIKPCPSVHPSVCRLVCCNANYSLSFRAVLMKLSTNSPYCCTL